MNKAIQVDRFTGKITIDFGEELYGNNVIRAETMLTCDRRRHECTGYGALSQTELKGIVGVFLCSWLREYGNSRPANCDQFVA